MFILIVMCVGVLIGHFLFPEKLKRTNEIFQIICTLTLIFAMGFSLGSDENFSEIIQSWIGKLFVFPDSFRLFPDSRFLFDKTFF